MLKKIGICVIGIIVFGIILLNMEVIPLDSAGIVKNEMTIEKMPEDNRDEIKFNGKDYKVFYQCARNFEDHNEYIAWHGCAVSSLTTILRAYVPECADWTPYDTINIAEKNTANSDEYDSNYAKELEDQMPITMHGISNVLSQYGIEHEYVTSFSSDEEAEEDIIGHLKRGLPVIFVVCKVDRDTGMKSEKWTRNYHTMVMIGTDGSGNVLIADPYNGPQRLKTAPVEEMIDYMWSCTEIPDGFYWNGKPKCGGYVKVL